MSDIVWKPSKEYIEKANITKFMKKNNIRDYQELIEKSTDDIEWFWNAALTDMDIEWFALATLFKFITRTYERK